MNIREFIALLPRTRATEDDVNTKFSNLYEVFSLSAPKEKLDAKTSSIITQPITTSVKPTQDD